MKKIIAVVLFLLLMIVGCDVRDSILEPDTDLNTYSLSKRPVQVSVDNVNILDESDIVTNYRTFYSKNFTIEGNKGGRIAITHSWKDSNGRPISLSAELRIPRNAFSGTLEFDMIFDLDNYSMELYPSPYTFDKPVEFSMYFYNLDLSQFENSELDFNYLDGEEEALVYAYKHVDFDQGNLLLMRAHLNHFSRYGWTRTR